METNDEQLQEAHNQGGSDCSDWINGPDFGSLSGIFSSPCNPPSDPELHEAYLAGFKNTWEDSF